MPHRAFSTGCELHPGARGELLGFYPFTESRGHTASVIASLWRQRWLGKRIRNPEVLSRVAATNAAELKALTTTSLYGNGSSQYNRLKLSAADFVNSYLVGCCTPEDRPPFDIFSSFGIES
jgi:hypothetical protein